MASGEDSIFVSYKYDDRKDVDDKASVEDTIEAGEEIEITHYNLSILRRLRDGATDGDTIDYTTESILETYLDELSNVTDTYEMTDEEFRRYKMRPDLFCYDKYGAMDFDFILLLINGINDEKDFNKKKILYIPTEIFDEVLSYMINAEDEYLENNREAYEESTFY